MDDLTAFVSARLDEDEAALADDDNDEPGELRFTEMDERSGRYYGHFAANDRVRREIAAKRKRLAAYAAASAAAGKHDDQYMTGVASGLADAIKDDAAVWSDHPDYKQEWATP